MTTMCCKTERGRQIGAMFPAEQFVNAQQASASHYEAQEYVPDGKKLPPPGHKIVFIVGESDAPPPIVVSDWGGEYHHTAQKGDVVVIINNGWEDNPYRIVIIPSDGKRGVEGIYTSIPNAP